VSGDRVRTVVRFVAEGFNKTEPRDYFINPCCFGDDVAKWLMGDLRKKGLAVDDEPGQEDFGWYFGFRFQGEEYHLVIGSMEDTPYWLIWLERAKGLIPSLFGARNRGIKPAAVQLIHDVLGASPNVSDMRWWHKPDFDRGADESLSSPSPV